MRPAWRRRRSSSRSVYGLPRVFDDAHPALGERIVRILARAPDGKLRRPPSRGGRPRRAAAPPRQAEADLIARSTALTPKEREVLELLARNLSNKEIGLTMNIHEDTVKWHVKNLFAKLSAGTRKQVVSRARLMGILAAGRLSSARGRFRPARRALRYRPPPSTGGGTSGLPREDTTLQETGRQGGAPRPRVATGPIGGTLHDRSD